MQLTDFQSIRPPFESKQEETLDWLVEAHAMAEGDQKFQSTIREKLWLVGCKPEHIEKRGHILPDFKHTQWEKMEIYRLHESPEGKNLSARASIFEKEVDKIFEAYYPEGSTPPDDLIHVTCTGYNSPSGAQKVISKRNWGVNTTVTHAYHMGCYGAIPAIRIGSGFLANTQSKKQVDIVHTELCCLHSNPAMHRLDQLVSQSLFADGFMKYSIVIETERPHIKLIRTREEIIPNSTHAMTWNVVGWGFEMSLSKEVPILIKRSLPTYLERLGINLNEKPIFAIHPGGPKILNYIQDLLQLEDWQMQFSFEVLKNYGNMSSATVPHIWEKILNDPEIMPGTKIVSLAFGPGLCISGALMEKACGS